MALTQRFELRPSQSLVMTPQLQQAIKLLQLNHLDLRAYIEAEIQQNPLLEREDNEVRPSSGETADETDAAGEPRDPDPLRLELTGDKANGDPAREQGGTEESELWDRTLGEQASGERDLPVSDWEESGLTLSTWSSSGGGEPGKEWALEQRLSEPETLRTSLQNQVNLEFDSDLERLVGTALIDLLDENGYLTEPLHSVAETLGCAEELVEAVHDRLQTFEPTGIFARNLRECLALQLAERDRLDPRMESLLDNLDLVAEGDFDRLSRRCKVNAEDLGRMLSELRSLDPRPALRLSTAVAQALVPDILMRADGRGGWILELNPDTLPRVLVNRNYYAEVSTHCRSKAEREYLTERLGQANWLVKALHQRATTILRVTSEVVAQQDAFFRHGIQHLKPLTLRQVAEAIDMHESTVSRVTSGKYLAGPRGVLEVKSLFSASIAGCGGADHSAAAVRDRLRALIDAEAPEQILSDDRIVEVLHTEGIDIARRTVAKYRDLLRIPSSVQRRKEKSHLLIKSKS
jgi:RNA polymerase sigma-54 factor